MRPELLLRSTAAVAAVLLATMVTPSPSGASGGRESGATDEPPVLVVGHRGASAKAPEHTGPSYDAAVKAGVDVLECDLQVTADEELVCVHDTTVDRTTGGTKKGRVDSYTLAELRAMDFGSWFDEEFAGARIVTLEEQVRCYRGADPTMQFYVETKAPAEYGGRMEPLLVAALDRLDVMPQGEPDVRTSPVIVQSFDQNSLAAVRRLAPSLPLAFLTVAPTATLPEGAPEVEVMAINTDALLAQPDVIEANHRAGREVHAWTVDEPDVIEKLVDDGIDGFFTNDPATGRTVVDAAGRGNGRKEIDPDTAVDASGCADGLGIGVAERAKQPSSSSRRDDEAGSSAGDADDEESDLGDLALAIAVVSVIAIGVVVTGVVISRRRRPRVF